MNELTDLDFACQTLVCDFHGFIFSYSRLCSLNSLDILSLGKAFDDFRMNVENWINIHNSRLQVIW